MMLLLAALLPWLGALLLAGLPATARRSAALLAGAVALAALALMLGLAPAVFAGQVPRWSVAWLPALGLDLGLRLDGLAWLFAMLITGIGALVVLYAAWYLDPRDPARRFFVFLLLFMGAMLGVVLADNLILLVLAWELTSLSSFLLIGYWHRRDDARQGARMALTITGAGGLCLLAGVLLIGHIVGSFKLDVVLASGELIRAHPLYLTALVLMLLGAFTKSAQFPFHFWLPHAMAAPTPVSAYLHSATMVKCGVFLLARLYPALGGSEPWFWIVSCVGLATLLVGAYVAIFQHDLKGLLAYSTISHLGLITLLFGLDEPAAVVAGVFHIINHATFKAGLFMSAGIIDHETGTRDMRRLAGLLKLMPWTATLGMTAAGAMAGVPLLNGFLSKEMFFAETVAKDASGAMAWVLPTGATLAGVFSVAYSLRFIHDTFFNGQPRDLPKAPHEAPFFMLLPVGLLVVLCIAVGLAPAWVAGPTLAVAAQAALHGGPVGEMPAYHLAIWHGVNLPLLMSAVAVAGGVLLYFGLQRFINLHKLVRLPGWVSTGGRDLFMMGTQAALSASRGLTDLLQNGSLQRYLALLVVMALAAGAWPFLHGAAPAARPAPLHLDGLNAGYVAVWTIGMAATVGTVLAWRQRLLAVVLMGAVGLVVCLAFVWFSAPDLALTQLLVEVATVMLLMLALRWLPAESPPEVRRHQRWRAWRDGALALGVGGGVAALVWQVLAQPGVSMADYFLQTALPLGGGSNVVNVIIVDYRGFDTLGEITVLVIAGLIIHALLAPVTAGQPLQPGPGGSANEGDRHPLMLQLAARALLPFVVLVSVYLYLRGHNQPGGGFIAGLVLALGLLVMHVSHGQRWVGERSPLDYRGWMGWGLLIAGGTGIASGWYGAPFLTTTYDYPWLPGVGGVPMASAAAFDLGVYLVVVGATVVMLTGLGRLSVKASR
jgi:multicomponent K+:H+ antiporter subunit A